MYVKNDIEELQELLLTLVRKKDIKANSLGRKLL